MVSSVAKNTWIRRQQCPCGDWKCFITYEGDEYNGGEMNTSLHLPNTNYNHSASKPMISPYVGMVFNIDDEAFEYYGNFARKNGFSIRKERSRLSPNLGIHKRDFVCYRSGFASSRRKPTAEHHRDRKSMRCGCDAKMYLSKEIVENGCDFKWFVVQFSNVHNHELLEDDQVRLLPAYRKIDGVAQERIILLLKAGFPIHKIYKVLETEVGNQGGKLAFVEKDVRNFVQNRKKVVEESDDLLKKENDLVELFDACRATKEGDLEFVYDVTMDENERVENIAWSYGDSVRAYGMFGDVVYFDATYRSVVHGMIFGAWLGSDSNGEIILFGCTLLQDDTSQSFVWALQTFVRFMKGSHPHTIITDLDIGLRDAIGSALPNSKHIISLCNILPKLSCWFSLPLGVQYSEFKHEFDLLRNVDSADDFEFSWNNLLGQYGRGSDRHVALLFSMRTCWASPYTRGCFLAMMDSTAYSKSVDALLKGFFRENTCLRSFFEQVGVSSAIKLQTRRDIQYAHIRTFLPIEEHARNILTPFAFTALQNELMLTMQCAVSEMGNSLYIISHYKKMDEEFHVTWKPEDEHIYCSCNLFESSGILCRHALRLLLMKNYFQIPEKYFPDRWRKDSSVLGNDNDEWYEEFHSLSGTLFKESLVSTERCDYVRGELKRELTRLVNEVRNMPAHETIDIDETPSPAD